MAQYCFLLIPLGILKNEKGEHLIENSVSFLEHENALHLKHNIKYYQCCYNSNCVHTDR